MEIATLRPDDRSIAEEFNQSYKEGILEVSINQATYNHYFKPLEYRYDEKDSRDRIEVVVPQACFQFSTNFHESSSHSEHHG